MGDLDAREAVVLDDALAGDDLLEAHPEDLGLQRRVREALGVDGLLGLVFEVSGRLIAPPDPLLGALVGGALFGGAAEAEPQANEAEGEQGSHVWSWALTRMIGGPQKGKSAVPTAPWGRRSLRSSCRATLRFLRQVPLSVTRAATPSHLSPHVSLTCAGSTLDLRPILGPPPRSRCSLYACTGGHPGYRCAIRCLQASCQPASSVIGTRGARPAVQLHRSWCGLPALHCRGGQRSGLVALR
jgi:hypothetical protein